MIRHLAKEGMAVARLNFSHGNHSQHQKILDRICHINQKVHRKIKVLQDLEGFRIRLGTLKAPLDLTQGKSVWMAAGARSADDGVIPLDTSADLAGIRKGMEIYIADGMICLKVISREKKRLKLKVIQGGQITSRKGVNIPGFKFTADILTAKDRGDVEFGIRNRVDYVALSFVRNKQDILNLKEIVSSRRSHCRIIAKIENEEGLKNIDEIISCSDGILVARGDLGVSLPIYQIPVIQKDIIRRCNRRKKLVITATQMLESMTTNIRPTRAEVSDVANAIIDGSDYVMLSGETALGKYPVETVRMMKKIIDYTQKAIVAPRTGRS